PFVLGPCASVGVQLIAPVAGLMVMPVGALTKAKVKLLAGMSASIALAFTFSVVCSAIVWSAGTVNTGARFTSLTVTVNVLVTLRAGTPLSVTLTLTAFVLGPCASVGVQLIAPLPGLMVMPVGALTKAKVKLLAGISASVALALTFSVVCSLIVWSAGTVSTGARFTSLTVTVKVLVTLWAGTPLSVTLTLTAFVLGPCAS